MSTNFCDRVGNRDGGQFAAHLERCRFYESDRTRQFYGFQPFAVGESIATKGSDGIRNLY